MFYLSWYTCDINFVKATGGNFPYSSFIFNCLKIFYVHGQKHTGSHASKGLDSQSGSSPPDYETNYSAEARLSQGIPLCKTRANECQCKNPLATSPTIHTFNGPAKTDLSIKSLMKIWLRLTHRSIYWYVTYIDLREEFVLAVLVLALWWRQKEKKTRHITEE